MTDYKEQIKKLSDDIAAANAKITEMATANATAVAAGTPNLQVLAYRSPKIPAFSRAHPLPWFVQAEITMRIAGITNSATKADFVAEKPDSETVMCVLDLLNKTPRLANLYDQIKERVIAIFGGSAVERLRQLLRGQVSLDGKPSLILN